MESASKLLMACLLFAGHQGPSDPLPGPTRNFKMFFMYSRHLNQPVLLFAPPSGCCKISLFGVASPPTMIRIKLRSPVLWEFLKCFWDLYHLPSLGASEHEVPSWGPSAFQLQILLLPKVKMLSPMGQETSHTSPFILPNSTKLSGFGS